MKRGIIRIQEPKGGIQFVVDPGIREELKPIMFFDAGKFTNTEDGFDIGYHPHSGIGIITYFHGTDLHHKDSGNNRGVIRDGGAQWIRAGKGVWHEEGYHRKQDGPKTGEWTGSIHQLWIQLPPEFEESDSEYGNLAKEDLAKVENVKVITGVYKGVKGKMDVPANMTYLDVNLKEKEAWFYETPVGQTTGFVFTRDGSLDTGDTVLKEGQMGILEHNEGVFQATALNGPCSFVLIIAEPSRHQVVAKGGQIHTNEASLARSTAQIREIGARLKR